MVVSPRVAPPSRCKGPLPLTMLGGGHQPRPLKGPAETSSRQPAAWEGRGPQAGREGCKRLRARRGGRCRRCLRGAGGPRGSRCRPSSSAGSRGVADRRSGRCWPRPAPGDPSHPLPALRRGGGGPARRPRPRRLPHSLAFPGRGLCSSLCAVPTSSAFTACTSSCSFPMARPGRSDAALRALGCQTRRRPRGCGRILSHPRRLCRLRRPPPCALRGLGLRRRGAGSASRAGGGPGAGARRLSHLPPGRLGPLPRPLTSVSPRRPRARLRGSAPASGPSPQTPPPHVQACGSGSASAERWWPGETGRGWGWRAGDLAAEPRHGGSAKAEPARGFQRLRDPRGRDSEAVGGRGPGHRWHGSRLARGCQTFLARGSRGRCRGIVKRNLPIMNSVSGNPYPLPPTTPSSLAASSSSPQTMQGDSPPPEQPKGGPFLTLPFSPAQLRSDPPYPP